MEQNKYLNGKIYRIISLNSNDIYIGSTINSLSLRLAQHVNKKKMYDSGTGSYTSSFEVLKHGNYLIELIIKFPCNSKDELTNKEGEYIRTMDCVNKVIPNRTRKEYNEENKLYFKDYNKKYYATHKDYHKKRAQTIIKCECGKETNLMYISKHRKSLKCKKYMDGKKI